MIACPEGAALDSLLLSEQVDAPHGTDELGAGTFACSGDACGALTCSTDPATVHSLMGRFVQQAEGVISTVVSVLTEASVEPAP